VGARVRASAGPRSSPAPARPAPNPATTEIKVLQVQKNVYLLASSAGNSTVARLATMACCSWTPHRADGAEELFEAIRTLTNKPIHTIVNTQPACRPHWW
jgi:hypothetical protein